MFSGHEGDEEGASERGEFLPKMERATAVALSIITASIICWSSPVSWEIEGVDIGRIGVSREKEIDQMMMGSE